MAGLNALVSSVAGSQSTVNSKPYGGDALVLQFALNLEYLEAEFYTYATTGHGIDQEGVGVTGVGTFGPTIVKTNPAGAVPRCGRSAVCLGDRTGRTQSRDLLRNALKSLGFNSVAKPTINLNDSWNALAQAAGLGSSFDPFCQRSQASSSGRSYLRTWA